MPPCFCGSGMCLKVTEFRPEYTGKMNFYVAAVDDLLRHPDDQPTIEQLETELDAVVSELSEGSEAVEP